MSRLMLITSFVVLFVLRVHLGIKTCWRQMLLLKFESWMDNSGIVPYEIGVTNEYWLNDFMHYILKVVDTKN